MFEVGILQALIEPDPQGGKVTKISSFDRLFEFLNSVDLVCWKISYVYGFAFCLITILQPAMC